MLKLNDSVTHLPLIGPKYANNLKTLNISTIKDLLYHFPFRYEDSSNINTINIAVVGETSTFVGTIASIQNVRSRAGKTLQKAVFIDNSGSIDVTWFNQPFLTTTFKKNPHVSLSGKITIYRNKKSLTSPEYESITSSSDLDPDHLQPTIHTGRIIPIYPLTTGISSKWLRSRINAALKQTQIVEWLPQTIIQQESLSPLQSALKQIHFPKNYQELKKAQARLGFDELFILQLSAQTRKVGWHQKNTAHSITVSPHTLNKFIKSFPFTLTTAQDRCIKQIISDLKIQKPMNRLLQGDVGSGKTAVAAAAAFATAQNNLTTIFMAPTEILAVQHHQTLSQLLNPFNLKVSLLTKNHHDPITNPIIVGTHAILHRQMPDNIGLIIIDEQHRFGVNQRSKLLKQSITPHTLSMTATPIPRTIALTLYTDLDVSVIDEMPPGRITTKTWVVPQRKRDNAYNWIKSQIHESNGQVFIVCPLISESDSVKLEQVRAATAEFEHIQKNIFPSLKVGLLHGQLKAQQKADVIKQFREGKLNILVTTPVIEVGVDIPNASIILIESAERFGLASLHQLRGRVGRSSELSYCLLFTTNNHPSKRLKHMETVHLGSELAELDLKLRGPGELFGIKQSGYINLKVASLTDIDLIQKTHRHAKQLIDEDPQLKNYPQLTSHLETLLITS